MVKSTETASEIAQEIAEETELDINEAAFGHLNRFRLDRVREQVAETNGQLPEIIETTEEGTEITVEEILTLSSGEWDGELLKSIRERLDLTQEDLGEIIDVTLHTISSWERHKTTPALPNKDHLVGYLLAVSAATE